jgi:uncharacterized protein (TIGR03083 family)
MALSEGSSMDKEVCIARIGEQFAAFSSVVEAGSLRANVPACPGWDLRQLALHLAETYRWVRAALGGTEEPTTPPTPALDDGEVAFHLAGSANALLAALRSVDPLQPCWTMAPPDNAGFWLRRMVHETTIHRWDAQSSRARPTPICPEVAYDGVREVAEMVLPRQVRLRRIEPLRHVLRLELSDVAQEVTLGREGLLEDARPDAWVSGPAEAILLLLWKRIDATDPRLRFGGDAAARQTLMSVAITP